MPRKDDVAPLPEISARREGSQAASAAVPRRRGAARGGTAGSTGDGGGGAGAGLWLLVVGSLLVAIGACAWAWQLQERLTQTGHVLERYEGRIAELEDRLADTDEGMSQNAAVQAAKIRELDSEVRKLWDNVWKRSKERLGVLEASSKRFASAIDANQQTIAATQQQLGKAREDLAALQRVGGDLECLMTTARASQTEVERVADALNRVDLELARLEKRVGGNEEWIGAINAFRQSTNASISQLQAAVRALQSPGGA
jgi:chromosome segregation ATPase